MGGCHLDVSAPPKATDSTDVMVDKIWIEPAMRLELRAMARTELVSLASVWGSVRFLGTLFGHFGGSFRLGAENVAAIVNPSRLLENLERCSGISNIVLFYWSGTGLVLMITLPCQIQFIYII
jgi:hypothetical protein